MRVFRYNFLKHLRWSTSYYCFFASIILSVLNLILTFSYSEKNMNIDTQYKICFFSLDLYMFIVFISYKAVEAFRDEIDDGTLLIINSMPYSRTKLAIQKWLAVQAICSIFVLSVVLLSPMICLLFSTPVWEEFKLVYKNSLWLIIRLVP